MKVKPLKESTQYTKNNGNINNTVINLKQGLTMVLKLLKNKQLLIVNNGYIKGGLDNPTGYEKPEPTTKDSTLFYILVLVEGVLGHMER